MLNKWLEISTSIFSMYREIAEADFEGHLDDPKIKNIINLLPTAIRMEKEAAEQLDLSIQNISNISKEIDSLTIEFDGKDDELASFQYAPSCRMLRYIEFNHLKCDLSSIEPRGLIEFIKYMQVKNMQAETEYYKYYLKYTMSNSIYVISLARDYVDDLELKLYLTILMYMQIYVLPEYESSFINGFRIRGPIDLKNNIYELREYISEEEALEKYKQDIIRINTSYIDSILHYKNEDINNSSNYKSTIQNLIDLIARNISINQVDVVEQLKEHLQEQIEKENIGDDASEVISLIEQALDGSIKLINEPKPAGRVLNGKRN